MTSTATSPDEYIASPPAERQAAMTQLRQVIMKNLPKGFIETMQYGMIGYAVPHSLYPAGYHCKPSEPLPFISIAAQKNFIALYHMGLYFDKELMAWFLGEYAAIHKLKPDMGKSCIRFRKENDIPFELIGRLALRLTPKQWIALYEQSVKR
jgi:hypothetical protein